MIVQDTMQYLSQLDPEVGVSVQEEFARQQRNIEPVSYTHLQRPIPSGIGLPPGRSPGGKGGKVR